MITIQIKHANTEKTLLSFVILILVIFSIFPIYNRTITSNRLTQSTNTNISTNEGYTYPTPDQSQPLPPDKSEIERLEILQSSDKDNNLIHDRLDNIISTTSKKTNNEEIKVILTLVTTNSNPSNVVSEFKKIGGQVTSILPELGMITGKITPQNIIPFVARCQVQKCNLGLIEDDREMIKLSNEADRLTNVNSYAWQNLNLKGDSNTSIAIFDSGLDDSHPILANYSNQDFTGNSTKIAGWFDATGDGAMQPEDFDGHGTNVAGIAAGNPTNSTDSNGDVKATWNSVYSGEGGLLTSQRAFPINVTVTEVGHLFNLSYTFIKSGTGTGTTAGTGLYLYKPDGFIAASDTNPTNNTFLITYTANSIGTYEIWPFFVYGNMSHRLEMFTYGTIPPPATLLNTSTFFSGVAPQTKLVGVKVFNNLGSGLSSFLVNGVDWVLANKNAYHITIASMSLGFPCNVTGCTSLDRVSSVEIAVNNLVNAGVLTVVAAGNDGDLANNQIGSPANLDKVITVGATGDFHKLADYSSQGPGLTSTSGKPDLTAPGGLVSQGAILQADTNDNEIEGTSNGIVNDFQKNDLTGLQGTSMATPHVSGIASLLIQALGGYQNWNYTSTEVNKVKQYMLMSTWSTYGTDRGIKDRFEGWGEIQADAVLSLTKSKYTVGSSQTINLSESQYSTKIWGRPMNLTANTQFNFLINSSVGLDVDVYIYEQDPDQFGNPIIAINSSTAGKGITESFSFTPLTSGTYYLFIKTWSGSGQVSVSSSDTPAPPTINGGNFVKFFENETGNEVHWTIIDFDPKNYTIFRNGIVIESGNVTGMGISIITDGLIKGHYNFTILVYDQTGLRSSFITTVLISQLPVISVIMGNTSYTEHEIGNVIKWSFTDDNYKNYSITFPNATVLFFETLNGTNVSNTITVAVNVDDLIARSNKPYIYTLTVNDWDNNTVLSTIAVTVISGTLPSSTSSSSSSNQASSSSTTKINGSNNLETTVANSLTGITSTPGLLVLEFIILMVVVIPVKKMRK